MIKDFTDRDLQPWANAKGLFADRNELIADAAVAAVDITERSRELFMAYARDAGNWSGTPLLGGNVHHGQAEQGNLTQLKKAGLLTTFEEHERGQGECHWIQFTDLGKAYARANGYDIDEGEDLNPAPPDFEGTLAEAERAAVKPQEYDSDPAQGHDLCSA